MMQASLTFFRRVGFAEGVSFLALLLIAMPLKYAFDVPEAVSVVGMLHGVLFVLYVVAIVWAAVACRWAIWKPLVAFAAAFLPFGPFVFDAKVARK